MCMGSEFVTNKIFSSQFIHNFTVSSKSKVEAHNETCIALVVKDNVLGRMKAPPPQKRSPCPNVRMDSPVLLARSIVSLTENLPIKSVSSTSVFPNVSGDASSKLPKLSIAGIPAALLAFSWAFFASARFRAIASLILSAEAAEVALADSSSTLSVGTGGLRVDEAVEGEGLFGVDFVRRRGDGLGEVGDRRVCAPNLDVGGVSGARGDVARTDEVVRRRDWLVGEVGESGAVAVGERGVLGDGERHLDAEGGARRDPDGADVVDVGCA